MLAMQKSNCTMPPKAVKVTKQEAQRRAEQSRRDKAMSKKAAKKPRNTPKQKVMPGMSQSDNVLALAMSAPQVTQPQRLPTLSRRKTDVKSLWLTGSVSTPKFPNGYANNAYISSTIGPAPDVPTGAGALGMSPGSIDPDEIVVYITRDPLCPMFITYTSLFIRPAVGDQSLFAGYDWKIRWPGDSFRVIAQTGAPTKTQIQFESSPLRLAFPTTMAANQVDNGTFAFAISPVTLTQATTTFFLPPPPIPAAMGAVFHGPTLLPAGYSAEGRSTYGWHAGGFLAIRSQLMRGTAGWPSYFLPAGLEAGISFVVYRFIGGDDMEEQTADGMIYCPIASGQFSGYCNTLDLAAGYYRVEARSYILANTTASAISAIGDVYAQFDVQTINVYWPIVTGWSPTISVNQIFPVTNMDVYDSGKFMLERCRVTASAITFTNTSAALSKSGTLQGARLYGTGFFTDIPLSKVAQIAGNPNFGYYGPLEKGGYTFLPPPQDPESFFDGVLDTANGSLMNDYPVASLDQMSDAHVYLAKAQTGDAVYQPTYSYRCDYHIEFISESQLATCKITAMPAEAFTEATIILTSGRYFFENPSHLKQLWGWIKSAGSLAIRAATSAAARSLLESATMAIVAF